MRIKMAICLLGLAIGICNSYPIQQIRCYLNATSSRGIDTCYDVFIQKSGANDTVSGYFWNWQYMDDHMLQAKIKDSYTDSITCYMDFDTSIQPSYDSAKSWDTAMGIIYGCYTNAPADTVVDNRQFSLPYKVLVTRSEDRYLYKIDVHSLLDTAGLRGKTVHFRLDYMSVTYRHRVTTVPPVKIKPRLNATPKMQYNTPKKCFNAQGRLINNPITKNIRNIVIWH